MHKKFLFIFSFLCYAVAASAQTSAISGTITDANGQLYKNGTYVITFRPVPGNPGPYVTNPGGATFTTSFTGALDSTGSFTGVTLQRNDFIGPANSAWTFQVCSQASAPCFSTIISITTATLNVSSLILPPAISIGPAGLPLAYSDSEIVPSNLTSVYKNLTDSQIHFCITVTSNNLTCTAWGTTIATGSSPSFNNLILSGNLTVGGATNINGSFSCNAPGNCVTPLRVGSPPLIETNEMSEQLGNVVANSYGANGLKPTNFTAVPAVTGSTSYSYAAYEYDVTASAFVSTFTYARSAPTLASFSNGPVSLSSINNVALSSTCESSFDSVRYMRYQGGTTQGFIGIASCATGTATLTDTGLTGNGTSLHTGDTSGLFRGNGLIGQIAPYLGIFTPQSGATTNATGFGSFTFESNNPFSSLFSCTTSLCVTGVPLWTGSQYFQLGPSKAVSLSTPNSGSTLYVGNGTFQDHSGIVEAAAFNVAGVNLPVSGANGISAGFITMAAGAGTHTFTTAYTIAPVCTASDKTSAAVVSITASTTVVTVAGTGTDVVAWICAVAIN